MICNLTHWQDGKFITNWKVGSGYGSGSEQNSLRIHNTGYSLVSHRLHTWRHEFLVPWLMFCTLFLLQPGVPWAAHLATWIPGPLAHVLYSIFFTACCPTGGMDSWSPGSYSVLYYCYSLASHGLRTWRRGFLVPWLMFYLILICLLFMVLAHTLSFQNLQLKQVTGWPKQDLTSNLYWYRRRG